MLQLVALALPALALLAAFEDLRAYRIPNWICAAIAGSGLFAILISGMPLSAMAAQLGVGAGALLLGFLLFALGVWGGGDGKLIAAAALWFDPVSAPTFVIVTLLAGGAVAILGLAAHYFRALIWRVAVFRALPIEKWNGHTPYGVSIAIGAIVAFPSSLIFKAAFG